MVAHNNNNKKKTMKNNLKRYFANLNKKNNKLFEGSSVDKEFFKSSNSCMRSTRDVIKDLEREILKTLSKLDISAEFHSLIKTYVKKTSENYLNRGKQPQGFLGPKDSYGRIDFLDFLIKLISSSELIQGNEAKLKFPSEMKGKSEEKNNFNVIFFTLCLTLLYELIFTFSMFSLYALIGIIVLE